MSFIKARTALLLLLGATALAPAGRAEQLSFGQVERGRYLVSAGDCEACHTASGGKPFAGGRAIQTPFGSIYSANITPDRQTGIGAWTDDQFYRALHQGIAADGSYLYPAFPYPWYTKVTRDDSNAIRAYLNSLDPVSNSPPPNKLDWPLDYRVVMKGWNELFFREGTFQPDPKKSPEWNRGAYLVEGLGHCGACHTPVNALGAAKTRAALTGGNMQDWFAPNLTADLRSGLGNWSIDDITTFLKTGRNARTTAYGPMSEVISFSTSKLNDADLKAIATYLKDMPPNANGSEQATSGADNNALDAGKALYVDNCSACHQMNGEGVPGMFPPLRGNTTVQDRDPSTIIRLIQNGAHSATTAETPTQLSMPAFGWKFSSQEIADLASYIRSSWGNSASAVKSAEVDNIKTAIHSTSGQK